MSNKLVLIDYDQYREYPVEEMTDRAESFYRDMKRRRTVRDFSSRHVPREIIENILRQPLRNFRAQFEESQFPPPTFQDSPNSSNTLRGELLDQLPDEWRRANVFAAVWAEGKHVPNLEKLSSKLGKT